jgi:hypothetical protein
LRASTGHSRNNTAFIKLLQDFLGQIEDGAITITKQENKIVQVTETELYDSIQAGKVSAADVPHEKSRATLGEYDFALLLKFLDGVSFGTVTLHIKSAQIVGVEKNEKIKL